MLRSHAVSTSLVEQRGSSMVNVAPAPGSLLTRTSPPCASTIYRVM
jgi:hypothetical protein